MFVEVMTVNKIRIFTLASLGLLLVALPLMDSHAKTYDKQKRKLASKYYHKALIESNSNRKTMYLRESYKLNPKDRQVAYLYGKTLIGQKNYREGKDILLKLSKKRSFRSKVYLFLGDHYFQSKNMVEANFYYKRVSKKKKKKDYLVNYRLGLINGQNGLKNYKKSNRYYLTAYKLRQLKGDHDILLKVAENYYFMGKYKSSIKYLNTYPHTNKNDQKAFRLLILNHLKQKDEKIVVKKIRTYRRIWPNDRWMQEIIWQRKKKKTSQMSKDILKTDSK
ncbi:MAG: hypothetical protein OEZ36_00675 [Spirochaetota bacterium]|nr:hypothetical protein [Spirochaetota bacterium]